MGSYSVEQKLCFDYDCYCNHNGNSYNTYDCSHNYELNLFEMV